MGGAEGGAVTWHHPPRFTEDFAYEVLAVVGEIPEGTVATYGQIARLIGRTKLPPRGPGPLPTPQTTEISPATAS